MKVLDFSVFDYVGRSITTIILSIVQRKVFYSSSPPHFLSFSCRIFARKLVFKTTKFKKS